MSDHLDVSLLPASSETLLFGDSFERTLEWIICEAMEADTPDAWEAADQQIHGLERLVLVMQDGQPRTHLLHLGLRLAAHRRGIDCRRDAAGRAELRESNAVQGTRAARSASTGVDRG